MQLKANCHHRIADGIDRFVMFPRGVTLCVEGVPEIFLRFNIENGNLAMDSLGMCKLFWSNLIYFELIMLFEFGLRGNVEGKVT